MFYTKMESSFLVQNLQRRIFEIKTDPYELINIFSVICLVRSAITTLLITARLCTTV